MSVKHVFVMSLLFFWTAGFSFAQKTALQFESSVYKFGKVAEGETLQFDFSCTNIDTKPVLINGSKVNCDCTKVRFPKTPIAPGAQAKIMVSFNTKGKIGYQERSIEIITDTETIRLIFKGVVKASQATKEAYKIQKKERK